MKHPSNIQVCEFGVGNVPVIKHKIPVFIGDFNIPCSLYGTTYRLPSNTYYNLSTLLFNSLRKQKIFYYVIKWLVVSVPCWYGVGKEILLRFGVWGLMGVEGDYGVEKNFIEEFYENDSK